MIHKIDALAKKNLEKIRAIRRELHQYPELGFQEFKTAQLIKRELDILGIPYKSEIAKTGVVALIKGGKPGKTVLLRADMDALPINEETECEYKSLVPGVMHACGHDGHVAGLLGAAMILNELKENISGNIKLVFQPAEEGPGGAKPMIDEGILEDPKVDAAYACHLWPNYLAGKILFKDGNLMAHPTGFDIEINGVGGHGSTPEKTVDPIIIGCQAIINFQNIISRNISAMQPAVLSCCSIKAGEAGNVIPDKLTIKGTIRTFDENLTTDILNKMDSILEGLCNAYGASYNFIIERMYPTLKNDSNLFTSTKLSLANVVGEDNVILMTEPLMGSEDFSYISNRVPSNFFFIGTKENQEDIETLLHHPRLKWDDKHLEISSKALAQVAYDYLEKFK
ncbi:M20 family metallopeptidase [Cetobacterium somerae]|uniref:M20 metallopeptidase family protein n=1 Tax=Cetobacterium sp. NK01 TaxID=2993530 RepID=UPI002116CD36|nr:M20 family metallopeptidase [Cetobacterium sp. NK01]MCQ8213437.1 M20 family metallopeptidase [Cetobacterium sp. NK01]